jgi:hypothetical protein
VTGDASGRGRSRRRIEDRSRSPDVGVHARLGDPEVAGDLLGREAARHRAQDLTLPIRQRGHRPRAPREDTPRKHISGNESD